MTAWFHIVDNNEERMSLERMNSTKLILVMLSVFATFIMLANASEPHESGKIVITQADEDAIKNILREFRQHQAKVSFRSDVASYLDCEAHQKLLKYGWKAVPYLVDQAAQREAVDAYIGSVLIKEMNVKTPQEVFEYNRRRKSKSANTLAPFILETVLRELPSGKIAPNLNKPKDRVGYAYNEVFAWVKWWQHHKDKFVFITMHPLVIPPLIDDHSTVPQVRTTVKDELLDIYAVDASYRQIIERAAAEIDIDVFIGEHEYLEVRTTIRMKSVTFEEFLYMAGRSVSMEGFKYSKTETGYRIGGKTPAKPTKKISGWGIMMGNTVFNVGDEIPVTVITWEIDQLVDPCDPVFHRYGSFQVTTNDGKIIKDYEAITKAQPTIPPITISEGRYKFQVLLNEFCKLSAGEYNIRFRYLNSETPSVAIELYDRKVE